MAGTNIGQLYYDVVLDTSQATRQANNFGKNAKKGFKGLLGEISPVQLGVAGVGVALAKAGMAAYNFSKEFETAFAEVATISDTAKGSTDEMKESILNLTTEIPIGAVEATKALYQIVSAGYDGAEGMELLNVSAKAAIAGVTDTATAADGITTILNAYNKDASEAAEVSDVLFTTVKLGKTTFGELASSFSQVAPLASSLGIDFKEVSAAVATLTKSGVPTAQAFTQIRSAILGTTEALGAGVFQANTLQGAFGLVAEAANNDAGAIRELVGRAEGMNAVLAVTGKNAKGAAEDLAAIGDSTGSAEAAFKTMVVTADNQLTLFKNNIMTVLNELGDSIKITTAGFVEKINEAFASDQLSSQSKALQDQRNKVNALVFSLNDLSKTEKERADIVKEIIRLAPSLEDQITKEGDIYDISAKALSDYNKERDEAVSITEKSAKMSALEIEIKEKQIQAEQKINDLMDVRFGAMQKITKVNEKDGNIVKALLDGTINKTSEFADVAEKFGDEYALMFNKMGLQTVYDERDFVSFQNQAIAAIAASNNLSKKQIGFNEEYYESVRGINDIVSDQVTYTKQLEELEAKRLAQLNEFSGDSLIPVSGIDTSNIEPVDIPVKFETVDSLHKELKRLLDQLSKATSEQSPEIRFKIGKIEAEIWDKTIKTISNDIKPVEIPFVMGRTPKAIKREIEALEKSIEESDIVTKIPLQLELDDLKEELKELENSLKLDDLDGMLKRAKDKAEDLKAALKGADDEIKKDNASIGEMSYYLSDAAYLMEDIAALAEASGSEMAEFASQSAQAVGALSEIGQGIQQGGVLGGLAAGLTGVLSRITGMYRDAAMEKERQYQAFLDSTTTRLERQRDLLDEMAGTERSEGEKQYLSDITTQMNELDKEAQNTYLHLSKVTKKILGMTVTRKNQPLRDFESMDDLIRNLEPRLKELTDQGWEVEWGYAEAEELIQRYEELEELAKSFREELTGTNSESIADMLVNGFAEGKKSMEDFTTEFKDLMKDAVLQTFKSEAIVAEASAFFDEFSDSMGGGLTESEILDLQKSMSDIVSNANKEFEELNKIFENVFGEGLVEDLEESANSAADGLTGAIQSAITEETGTELVGLWTRSTVEIVAQTSILNQHTSILSESNTHLANISSNTLRTAIAVEAIEDTYNNPSSGRDSGNIL